MFIQGLKAKRRNMVSVHITQVKKEYQQMGNLMVMNDKVWYTLSIYTFTYIIE